MRNGELTWAARYENADCLVGVHRDQEVNSSKALTLDLRQVSLRAPGIGNRLIANAVS